jgi:hypothetical protein
MRENNKRYYAANKEQEQARGRAKYRAKASSINGYAEILLSAAKQRAKKRGLQFTIDRDWVAERLAGRCEITSLPFDLPDGGPSKRSMFGPTIDRVVPEKGYTKDNCKMVVWTYNAAKGSGTHANVLRLCHALINPQVDK